MEKKVQILQFHEGFAPVKEQQDEKIIKHFQKKIYDEQVSKSAVLHHLKQLKAHIGKAIIKDAVHTYDTRNPDIDYNDGLKKAMKIIDNKIKKIK